MGPVCVMERSVAAGQGFELAGLVLERNTLHSANWGRLYTNGMERTLFFPAPYLCVSVCFHVCVCAHVHHSVKSVCMCLCLRVIKEKPLEHTT